MGADKTLFYTTAFAISIGIVFSLSLPVFTVLYFDFSHYHFFVRQLGVGLVSILIIWILSRLDPDKRVKGNITMFEAIGFAIFFGSFLLLIVMQFLPTSIVPITGGAKRWIRVGPLSLAPAEFFKVGFAFFLAWSFTRKIDHSKKRLGEEFLLLLPYFLMLAIAVIFIAVMQKDLGQVVVLVMILMVLGTFAGTSKKFFTIMGLCGVLLGIVLIMAQPHRIRRLESWWATNQDVILSLFPQKYVEHLYITNAEEPYQITHSLNAFYHGGFFGTGLGGGTFKLGFLSEVHTDFVLAGITEEIGFLGLVGLVCLIGFIIFKILRISSRSQNNVYHLFSLGVGIIIAAAFIINALGVSSVIPVKGIAVPFFSYGGSSILALSVAIGMVLMLSKKVDLS